MENLSLSSDTETRRTTLHGVPAGAEARVLLKQVRAHGCLMHIALDDAHVAMLTEGLNFFAPEVEVISFPAWDCLPYDRVSPSAHIVGERVIALTKMANLSGAHTGTIILTTLNALTQRVPPKSMFKGSAFDIHPRGQVDIDKLQSYLIDNGYNRVDTVREPGEFAMRGGLMDLYPPALELPVRMDLFGDEVESLRVFDPFTQQTSEDYKNLMLGPVSEIMMNEASTSRFRQKYREMFGVAQDNDPLYEAMKAGHRHAGMEHWLPLFYDTLDTVFDYLPTGMAITLDHQFDIARGERSKQVADFYRSRKEMEEAEQSVGAVVYHPVPVNQLYISPQEWLDCLSPYTVMDLAPFSAPEGLSDANMQAGRSFSDVRAKKDGNVFVALKTYLDEGIKAKKRVIIAGYSKGACDRLKTMLEQNSIRNVILAGGMETVKGLPQKTIALVTLSIEHGFDAPDMLLVTEQDILGDRLVRPTRRTKKKDVLADIGALSEGDYVVHDEHGIGQFETLETVNVQGVQHDCLKLIYAGGDRLFLPVENLELLSRYGSAEAGAVLDKLGGAGWQSRKARAKKDLMEMAEELLKIAAARVLRKTEKITVIDDEYNKFSAGFPYIETEDQLRAINDAISDLGKGQAMDRLVCGDVGFGKTEVALRTAFVAAMAGYQVAVVAPTTLLCRQHFQGFMQRFKGFPLRMVQLSRLVKPREAKRVKDEIETGSANVIIGTHALLNDKIKFNNLGLLIVDEEQRFGVKQKEVLKALKENVHVLTLTATPIPRTLQMSLTGVKDLSLMATPPVDRLAVRTFVMPSDPMVLREALMREHFRGGQSYYVCPRIADLAQLEENLRELVPELKYVVVHGQMLPEELEDRVSAFYDGTYDILLATNIIESGIDIPNVNTIVIHRAEMFGLAQLYQLRGRIGRSKVRGYAYLTYDSSKKLTKQAQQRLQVIEKLNTLGAGFQLASHDMDIRGAGNLLGEEQSGHIKEIGVELYQQMLEEAVAAAKDGVGVDGVEEKWTPHIELGTSVLIPERYVKDLNVRLNLYRRISELLTANDIESFAAELIDRFGDMPDEVKNLLDTIGIKQLCKAAGVARVEAGPKGAVITFRNNKFSHVDKLIPYIQEQLGTVKIRPKDEKLVYIRGWHDVADRVTGVQRCMRELVALTAD